MRRVVGPPSPRRPPLPEATPCPPPPESTSKTCAGEWTEKEAGGSHLHMTFSKNPRYHLRLTSPHRAKVVCDKLVSGYNLKAVDFIERAVDFEIIAADVFGTGKHPKKAQKIFLESEWSAAAESA